MARMTKLFTFVFWVALMMTATAPAQTQRREKHFPSKATPDKRM